MSPMVMPEAVRKLITMRRAARGWSLVVVILLMMWLKTTDPNGIEPVSTLNSFLVLLLGVAVSGLLIAWRWERTGAILTIVAMVIREIAWLTLREKWMVSTVLLWVVLLPPAIMYLSASRLERQLADAYERIR